MSDLTNLMGGTTQSFLDLLFTLILVALIICATNYYAQALGTLIRRRDATPAKRLTFHPTVSVVVPMHNEAVVIPNTLKALSMIDYPHKQLEVIVVDDASTDETGALLDTYTGSFPFPFKVIHRDIHQRRGKPAAVNEGILASTGDVLVLFDADHRPEPDCIELLVSRLAVADPRVGAVQGRTKYINEDENMITRIVATDRDPSLMVYLEAGRLLGLPIYCAGSTVAFRRLVFSEVGLFNENSVTEDTDFSTRMYLHGFTVQPELGARSYEEAVNNFSAWRRRTYRWARGHNRVFFDYWRQLLSSRHLSLGQKLYLEFHLTYYAIPTLIMIGMVLYAVGLIFPLHAFFHSWSPLSWLEFSLAYFVYCFFAIPTLIVVGTHLTGRRLRDAGLFAFHIPKAFVDVWTCTHALLDEVTRREYMWAKTPRSGVISRRQDVDWLLRQPDGR